MALFEAILLGIGLFGIILTAFLLSVFQENIFTNRNRLRITTPLCKGVMFFRCKNWNDGTLEHNSKTCGFCKKYDGWKNEQDAEEKKLINDLAVQYNAKEIRSDDIMLQYGYELHDKVIRRANQLSSPLDIRLPTADIHAEFDNTISWGGVTR